MRCRLPTFLFAILLITGCEPAPTPSPAPTPQVITVAYPASLRPFIEILPACLPHPPSFQLFLEEVPSPSLDSSAATITFWLTDKPPKGRQAAPIASEEVWVVVNAKNPLKELGREDVRKIFGGKIESWQALDGMDRAVSVWIYPPGNEVQALFEERFDLQGKVTSLASLTASPQAMLEAVAADPGAIGVLPGAWLDRGLTPLEVVGTKGAFKIPLLAITEGEPSGATREIIACLQSPAGQDALSPRYRPWSQSQ